MDRRDPGGDRWGPGRFLKGLGGPFEKEIVSFLGGDFVSGLVKYECVQFRWVL